MGKDIQTRLFGKLIIWYMCCSDLIDQSKPSVKQDDFKVLDQRCLKAIFSWSGSTKIIHPEIPSRSKIQEMFWQKHSEKDHLNLPFPNAPGFELHFQNSIPVESFSLIPHFSADACHDAKERERCSWDQKNHLWVNFGSAGEIGIKICPRKIGLRRNWPWGSATKRGGGDPTVRWRWIGHQGGDKLCLERGGRGCQLISTTIFSKQQK